MTERLKIFTAFSGYDSQLLALRDMGVPFDCVGWSEIDPWAIKAHNVLFPELAGKNFGDIQRIEWTNVPSFDMFTYSFPCQDISINGKMKGLDEHSGTRSALLWECKRAIEHKRPRFLLMENVVALISTKFIASFEKWEKWLRKQGYINYTEILNAKHFGIPQNRERVFMVSVLDGGWFVFPPPKPLSNRLVDFLEQNVSDKYYLSEKASDYVLKGLNRFTGIDEPVCRCLMCKNYQSLRGSFVTDRLIQIGSPHRYHNGFSKKGIWPTILTGTGENYSPKIWNENNRIRRLTPSECLRLMGLSESDIVILCNAGISDTQLYKLAGNSIVKHVLMAILSELFRFNSIYYDNESTPEND